MKRLLKGHGGRRARATLGIEAKEEPLPAGTADSGFLITVTLVPEEFFVVVRGFLELVLSTTHFSRTVLDGYREHKTERVWKSVELCRNVKALPGNALVYSATFRLPEAHASNTGPALMQWQARAGFDLEDARAPSAVTVLRDAAASGSGAPVVDGTGFLPLYEFHSGPHR